MLTFDIKVNSNLQMVVTLPLKFLLLKIRAFTYFDKE